MKAIALFVFVIAGSAQDIASGDWGQMMMAGISAFDAGRYPEAQRFYAAALRKVEAEGTRDIRMARSLFRMGHLLTSTGTCEDASQLLVRAVQIFDSLPDAIPVDRAAAWENLGANYFCRRFFSQAGHAYREALLLEESAAKPSASMRVSILTGLGAIYQYQRRYAEATAVLERARILSSNDDSRNTVLLLNNLGSLHELLHQDVEAEAAFRAAITVLEKITPRDDTAAAIVQSNLAMIVTKRHQYSEGVKLFSQAMEAIDRGTALPPVKVAPILQNYAICLRKSGQKSEARKIASRANLLLRNQLHQDPGTWLVGLDDLARGN